jgi:uncharacterized membrane protein
MEENVNIEMKEQGADAYVNTGSVSAPAEEKERTQYPDFTSNFDEKDIAENKIFAMSVYALSVVGIVIALLAAGNSAFVRFHVKEALKISILEIVTSIVTLILFWTVIVPVLGGIIALLMTIARVIGFVNVCKGKAIRAFVVRDIDFLN